jgi:hypothetical protein
MLAWQEVAWWVGHSEWCSRQQDEMTGNLNWDRARRMKEEWRKKVKQKVVESAEDISREQKKTSSDVEFA